MRTLFKSWPSEIHGSLFSEAARHVLAGLPTAVFLVAGCTSPKAPSSVTVPEVEVEARLRSHECTEEHLAIFQSGNNTESFRKDRNKKM